MTWRTKPTDRFVLRFMKVHLSAPLSQRVVRFAPTIRPSSITVLAASLGIVGGIAFGIGLAWVGGLLAAIAQVLDGVDGQVARLTDRVSTRGAFLDSVLDRYMDFSLMFGMLFYTLRFSSGARLFGITLSPALLIVIAALAVAGSSQVSYTTARAGSLKLEFDRPESAGKGSRTTAIVLSGVATLLWVHAPLVGLLYLALHTNLGVLFALAKTMRPAGARDLNEKSNGSERARTPEQSRPDARSRPPS